ncbi:MAG: hypothetical protein CMI13_04270 [Oleibacter sp.]|nr:hypothetical protein [Thalassolituus sp.]|tara:strand:+ start:441 stop:716 length:276 start_codon:yes stop_codon:yes gene_type:complete
MTYKFTSTGYLKFNHELHGSHGCAWTTSEEKYLIQHYYSDGVQAVALALARTDIAVQQRAADLRKAGRLIRPKIVTYKKREITKGDHNADQ